MSQSAQPALTCTAGAQCLGARILVMCGSRWCGWCGRVCGDSRPDLGSEQSRQVERSPPRILQTSLGENPEMGNENPRRSPTETPPYPEERIRRREDDAKAALVEFRRRARKAAAERERRRRKKAEEACEDYETVLRRRAWRAELQRKYRRRKREKLYEGKPEAMATRRQRGERPETTRERWRRLKEGPEYDEFLRKQAERRARRKLRQRFAASDRCVVAVRPGERALADEQLAKTPVVDAHVRDRQWLENYVTQEHSDPDQLQIAPGRIRKKRKKNDNGVQDDSEVQESESILPDDGPGWGGSSDESATPVNTIKTEPPDYVEQDEEPGSHLASVKSESEHFEEDWKPNSRVPALTKATELPDYTDMTQVTFHLNAEPQVPEVTRLHGGATVAVKIEPQDATEVCTEAVPVGTDVRDSFAAQQWANVPVNTKLGSDGSSGISAMGAVTIKTEPPEYVEQDEEPGGHLVSVTSEPQCYDDVWKPGNLVPALPKGEPPDYMDATKVTFHTNPVPQVSEGAQQRGNAEVAVKIEPQDPTEVDDQAVSAETGLGAAAPKEFQQDLVPVNPLGSYALMAQPPQWVFPTVSDKAQPQANIIYYHKVEQHGIAMQPVVTTLPVVAVQSVVAAESEQAVVVAVQPQHPAVAPAWLPGSEMGGESGAQQGLSVLLNAGSGTSAASSQEVEQHRVHINPTIPVQPPWHAPSAVCEGVQPQEDLVQFHEFERS